MYVIHVKIFKGLRAHIETLQLLSYHLTVYTNLEEILTTSYLGFLDPELLGCFSLITRQ